MVVGVQVSKELTNQKKLIEYPSTSTKEKKKAIELCVYI